MILLFGIVFIVVDDKHYPVFAVLSVNAVLFLSKEKLIQLVASFQRTCALRSLGIMTCLYCAISFVCFLLLVPHVDAISLLLF